MVEVVRRWPYLVVAASLVASGFVAVYRQSFESIGGAWSVIWIGMLIVGAVITARVPGNTVGPLCLTYGLLVQLVVIVPPVGIYQGPDTDYAVWSTPIKWAVNTAAIVLLPVMLARFPDGKLLSSRWRLLDVVALVFGLVGGAAAFINNSWGGDVNQVAIEGPLRQQYGSAGDTLSMLFFPSIPFLSIMAAVSLVIRYRRADARQRRQLRWLIYAVATGGVGVLGSDIFLTSTSSATDWAAWVTACFIALWPAAIGIAIVREGLYDIDVLISRTLIYGSILAGITGIYVVIVFGVGSLIGTSAGDSPLLAILATGIIALAFQPIRNRLERLANRVVFGRRSTPYEVLSTFTQRVAATDDQLLSTVAQSVTDGTVATAATLWALDDGVLEPISIWPESSHPTSTPALYGPDDTRIVIPGADETFPIEHEGEIIGALGLSLPSGETLPGGDQALITELTAGIGLALWNRDMTANLQTTVDELRASRRRLVAVQDETRHHLERNLHDGAQQRLVALKVRLSIAQQMAAKAGATRTATTLATACTYADESIESLRDFARGVYPPLLEAEGLAPALQAQITRVGLPVDLTSDIERRHSRNVEATIYFGVLETLNALDQTTPPSAVRITITDHGSNLTFDLRASHHTPPAPFAPPSHLRDRIEALDGSLTSTTEPIATNVRGSVPVASPDRSVDGRTNGHRPPTREVLAEP